MAKHYDNEANLTHKAREIIKLMTVQTNHFPAFEKYRLVNRLMNLTYDIIEMITECEKKYNNKTSLTNLDIKINTLKNLLYVAHEMGYYKYNNGKTKNTPDEATRRYVAISCNVNEIGAIVGGWIRANYAQKGAVA